MTSQTPSHDSVEDITRDLRHLASPLAETLSESQRITQFCHAVYELEKALTSLITKTREEANNEVVEMVNKFFEGEKRNIRIQFNLHQTALYIMENEQIINLTPEGERKN